MFYGDVTAKIPSSRPLERGAGGRESLDRAAEMLAAAKNPVIVSGMRRKGGGGGRIKPITEPRKMLNSFPSLRNYYVCSIVHTICGFLPPVPRSAKLSQVSRTWIGTVDQTLCSVPNLPERNLGKQFFSVRFQSDPLTLVRL